MGDHPSNQVFDVADLDRVDWARFTGAYGPSVGEHDVAAALRTLATDHDVDSDLRNDALDLVLWSHGWHQGTIYEVTAEIVPFLVAWIERGHDVGDGELAGGLELIAAAANDPQNARFQAGVHAALVSCTGTILSWREMRPRTVALVCGLTPGMRARWLDELRESPLETVELLVLAAGEPPPWAVEYATEAASDLGAAVLLAVHGLPPALARTVEAALGPVDLAEWRDVLELLRIEVPKVRAPVDELQPGQVVFVGPNLLLVRVGERNVKVSVSSTGLVKGETVRVGLSQLGEARVLELRDRNGGSRTIDVP